MNLEPSQISASASTIVCTIAAKNYLAHARTLMRSVAEHQTDCRLVTLVVDHADGYFEPDKEPFEILFAANLEIPLWPHMSMKYEITELSTAVKPYLLEKLFKDYHAARVIYFDPDILVYQPLDRIVELLDTHGVLLTPHILEPLDDDKSPGELDFLRVGTFNLGFIALARGGPWRELLRWWQSKLYSGCVRDLESGHFVDQHWMDLAPSLFDGVHILRDPGHNLAYWNLKNRKLQKDGNSYVVSNHPLIFFHFSGFVFDDLESVSKYQNRHTLSELSSACRECFETYQRALSDAGIQEIHKWPYSFATFSDGQPVTDILRRCLREQDPDGARWPQPWALGASDFRNWATTPWLERGSHLLSPYSVTLHDLDPSLQRAFPELWDNDELDYARWFIRQESSSPVFHPFFVDPVAKAVQLATRRGVGWQNHTTSKPPVLLRLRKVIRYFRDFPEKTAPNIPPLAVDLPPTVYNGPPGLYAWMRRSLVRLGVLRRIRKAVGLRLILTVRYFFTYPVEPGSRSIRRLRSTSHSSQTKS